MKKDNQMLEWCDSELFHDRVSNLIKPVFSVLDIGCGIRPQQLITPELLICIEPHLEYVDILKKNLQGANVLIIPLDAKQALRALPDRSIDSIFLIDVIEHMTKEVGMAVIRECERVARQQVILFTPLGFMPQEIHAGDVDGWNLHGGEWQDHKSGWYPEDFLGWNVVACKHLHFNDFKGQPINPPYGGFYAIKSIVKSENYFNDVYSKETLLSCTNQLPFIQSLFPQFIDKIVYREMENSILKCGIQSCQRTTELFIELGTSKSIDELFKEISNEKDNFLLLEARQYNAKIREFASQFSDCNSRLNQREADLNQREADLNQREADLNQREEREADLNQREADLNQREADLNQREAVIVNSLCGKFSLIYRKLKDIK